MSCVSCVEESCRASCTTTTVQSADFSKRQGNSKEGRLGGRGRVGSSSSVHGTVGSQCGSYCKYKEMEEVISKENLECSCTSAK